MKKKLSSEKGQSIIEMVLFLPLMVMLFIYLINLSGSINGAINQQKVTRSYFYSRLKNNSFYPLANDAYQTDWSYYGMSFIGWREKFKEGTQEPLMSCFPAKVPFFPYPENNCDTYQSTATAYVRVGTVYGMCGSNYRRLTNSSIHRGVYDGPGDVASWAACTIQE